MTNVSKADSQCFHGPEGSPGWGRKGGRGWIPELAILVAKMSCTLVLTQTTSIPQTRYNQQLPYLPVPVSLMNNTITVTTGMACSDSNMTLLLWSMHVHIVSALYSTVFFLLHGLSLPVRTGNTVVTERINNGTPAVLSARAFT